MDENTDNYLENPQVKKGPLSNIGSGFIDLIQVVLIFFAIYAIIHLFIAQPHRVSGSSMVPTLHDGDMIITEKLSYDFGQPQKGDIIVFKNPRDESVDFVKRVIGLPGDTIKVSGGKVYINDKPLSEKYLPSGIETRPESFLSEGEQLKLGPDQYFVLGDNRNFSSDSREWGTISKEEINGKVILRYWPFQDFGTP